MNFEKLGKRIRRELARSPKKSAVLGIMTLVALYFWVPILSGWIRPKPRRTVATNTPAQTVTATNATTVPTGTRPTSTSSSNSSTPPTTRSKHPWYRIQEWIQADADMHPAPLSPSSRHPFVNLERQRRQAQADAIKKQQSKLQFEIQNLNLSVSTTLVGSRGGRATINGIVYKQGDPIRIPKSGNSFVLTDILVRSISTREVVLVQKGYEYKLHLPEVSLAKGDEVIAAPRGQNAH